MELMPDVIIQHIQSFLERKEAARTILVSKSWLRAWSTRPFLDFKDIRLFGVYGYFPSQFIGRTLQSYADQGISVVRFELYIRVIEERWLKLLRQNNVIELHLVSTAFHTWKPSFFREIFLTKSLKVLRLYGTGGFQLILSPDDTDMIKCVKLKKLQIRWMHMAQVTFQLIMSSCPLIEQLLLQNCRLIDFRPFKFGNETRMVEVEQVQGRGCASLKRLPLCASLKRLSLDQVEINDEQLQIILSKTPQLEDLTLYQCHKLVKPLNLSSVSLKSVDFDWSYMNKQVVSIDAPNLHELKYNSTREIPFPVTIASPITKGVVKVSIIYTDREIDISWFHGLREFLTKFAKSYVEFRLPHISCPLVFDCKVFTATPLPSKHEVEILRCKGWFKYPLPVLHALFTICHPKIVLLGHLQDYKIGYHVNLYEDQLASLEELYNDLSDRGKCCNFRIESWKYYVKDAKLHYVVNNEQKPLDMNGIKAGLWFEKEITLALEWESSH